MKLVFRREEISPHAVGRNRGGTQMCRQQKGRDHADRLDVFSFFWFFWSVSEGLKKCLETRGEPETAFAQQNLQRIASMRLCVYASMRLCGVGLFSAIGCPQAAYGRTYVFVRLDRQMGCCIGEPTRVGIIESRVLHTNAPTTTLVTEVDYAGWAYFF